MYQKPRSKVRLYLLKLKPIAKPYILPYWNQTFIMRFSMSVVYHKGAGNRGAETSNDGDDICLNPTP
jgi:hypothetical protein